MDPEDDSSLLDDVLVFPVQTRLDRGTLIPLVPDVLRFYFCETCFTGDVGVAEAPPCLELFAEDFTGPPFWSEFFFGIAKENRLDLHHANKGRIWVHSAPDSSKTPSAKPLLCKVSNLHPIFLPQIAGDH